MPSDDLIQTLLDAVDSEDDQTAEAAAQACTGRTNILPALIPLLDDPDIDRRWWATRTLVLIGGPAAQSLLHRMAEDADEGVRCVAMFGLGTLRAEQAIGTLVLLLAHPSGWVRDSAADALALIGEPAVAALIQALGDPRDGVRVRAAAALRRIGLVGGQPGANLDSQTPRGQAISALFRALQDPNYLVRANAQQALDQLGLLDNVIVI